MLFPLATTSAGALAAVTAIAVVADLGATAAARRSPAVDLRAD
jgi:hypothetical protein